MEFRSPKKKIQKEKTLNSLGNSTVSLSLVLGQKSGSLGFFLLRLLRLLHSISIASLWFLGFRRGRCEDRPCGAAVDSVRVLRGFRWISPRVGRERAMSSSSADKELEEQLAEAGKKLLEPPSALDELLRLLDVSSGFRYQLPLSPRS